MSETSETPKTEYRAERNDPCPCGSGRKFKKCHGMQVRELAQPASAPETGNAAADTMASVPGGLPPGMNPKMMWEMAKVLRKVPKGQLQKLQSLMQQAMAGKDVSREAQALQASLPPEVQQMLIQMSQQMPQSGEAQEAEGEKEKKGFFSKWRKKDKAPAV